jgi:hypothetical protein
MRRLRRSLSIPSAVGIAAVLLAACGSSSSSRTELAGEVQTAG